MIRTQTEIASRLRASSRTALVAGAALALAGCGVTFKAEHVPKRDLVKLAATQPGIYYALPLTEFVVEVPVEISRTSGGAFAKFDDCLVACSGNPNQQCRPASRDEREVKVMAARVEPRSAPDPDHVYRVQAETDNPFMTVNHEFTLAAGTLTSAKLSGSNETVAVLVSSIGSVIGVPGVLEAPIAAQPELAATLSAHAGATAFSFPPLRRQGAAGAELASFVKQSCELIATPRDKVLFKGLAGLDRDEAIIRRVALGLSVDKKRVLSCPEVSCIADTLVALRQSATDEIAAAHDLVTAAPATATGSLATVRLAHAKSRSDEWLARAGALRSGLGLDPKTQKATIKLSTDPALRPRLLAGEDPRWTFDANAWRVDALTPLSPEEAPVFMAAARKALAGLTIEIQPTPEFVAQTAQGSATAAARPDGYRYRLPARGRVVVKQGEMILADAVHAVAQFGVIAALPSHFTGLSASLDFALHDDGTLTSVKLGQKAQSAAPLQTATAALQKRDEQRDGAALKGAQGDNNLAGEQIKADKLRRCQEAIKALSPDKPWPDICK